MVETSALRRERTLEIENLASAWCIARGEPKYSWNEGNRAIGTDEIFLFTISIFVHFLAIHVLSKLKKWFQLRSLKTFGRHFLL